MTTGLIYFRRAIITLALISFLSYPMVFLFSEPHKGTDIGDPTVLFAQEVFFLGLMAAVALAFIWLAIREWMNAGSKRRILGWIIGGIIATYFSRSLLLILFFLISMFLDGFR